MKIVVLDGYCENPGDLSWEPLKALGDLTIYDRTSLTNKEEIVQRIGDAEAVLTNKTPLSEDIFAACPKIKYIGVLATGYNVVDTVAAKRHHILVTNIPSYATESVAQFVFGFLFEICFHISHYSEEVHKGKWEHSIDFSFCDIPLRQLSGKTIGIIGFGKIGRQVAKIAQAIGMDVLAYSRTQYPEYGHLAEYVSLEELLNKSDVITLHCPLFPDTKNLINKNTIAQMKDGVILINTSRGPVINEQDVADALNSGKISAAGVDVVSSEPIKSNNPLLKAKNCLITPHIAWAPIEIRQRLLNIAVENLSSFVSGKPVNVVNN